VSRALTAALVLAVGALSSCRSPADGAVADYVGTPACAGCHAAEYAVWSQSLHAKAAAPASPAHSVAAWDGRPVVARSTTATPTRQRDGLRFEAIDGGDARAVALILGRRAVEQHLVPGTRGRLQAFPLAFDPSAQEWFDVFPAAPQAADWAHWEQPGATANSQCLECHVTGFEKGYDVALDGYATRWTELGVGCEACHGPGARHVAAHRGDGSATDPYSTSALLAHRSMDPCMPCHALRVPLTEHYVPGEPLADHFDVELLDGGRPAAGRVPAVGGQRPRMGDYVDYTLARRAIGRHQMASCGR
jgi:hypothetical protein